MSLLHDATNSETLASSNNNIEESPSNKKSISDSDKASSGIEMTNSHSLLNDATSLSGNAKALSDTASACSGNAGGKPTKNSCLKTDNAGVITNTKRRRRGLWALLVIVVLLPIVFCFLPMGTNSETRYILVDTDDNVDSVSQKVKNEVSPWQMVGFRVLSVAARYSNHVFTGRYQAKPFVSAFTLVRILAKGRQTPINLTLPQGWTKEDVAGRVAQKMMFDSLSLVRAMQDDSFCRSLGGLDTTLIATILIPNTYQLYWNISATDFLKRMYKESLAFWNDDRLGAADALGLTKEEVYTLASIVDAETTNNAEKPLVAGMYLNRLEKGMPLQADPTIKFALRRFDLKRIFGDMLRVDSPYNTYIRRGLPPGPIRIPSLSSIEAVLHPANHDYLYMCAKADLSGTHVFSRTFSEHRAAAAAYARSLNDKGIH